MRLRKESRPKAWADMQERLMQHMGALVPETTSLKDLLGISVDIESFLKTEQGSQSMDPAEALQNWLNAPATRAVAQPPLDDDDEDDSDSGGTIQ